MQCAMLKTALSACTFFADSRVCGSGSYAVSTGEKEIASFAGVAGWRYRRPRQGA